MNTKLGKSISKEDFMWEFLPPGLREVFDIVNVKKTDTEFHIWLDEIRVITEEDERKGCVVGKGYTDYRTIQDHLTRGRKTFLHLRKCKWLDRSTGEIFSYDIDYANEDGTTLTRELVAFLKGEDRD